MTDDLHRREAANRHVNPGDNWPECWPDAPEPEPGWEGWVIASAAFCVLVFTAAAVAGIWSAVK